MIAFLLSPLGRWLGASVAFIAVLAGIFLWGDSHGALRVQTRFDAYKVQVQHDIATEQARQKAEADKAIASLTDRLHAASAAQGEAEKAADALRDAIAARPPVKGRGATAEDVRALR
jgi:hypothetical protein